MGAKAYWLLQPKRLESLALLQIGHWIASQAKKLSESISKLEERDPATAEVLLSEKIKIIRNLLNDYVPKILHDELASKAEIPLSRLFHRYTDRFTSKLTASHDRIIGRMIEILFTKNLTRLFLDRSYDMDYFGPSFYSKTHLLTGLVHLRISPNRDADNEEASIIQSLSQLHNLRHLYIENICTDNILNCIVRNCVLIEELKILNSKIDNMSVDILIQLKNLRKVELARTRVSPKGVVKILMSCEKLEYIEAGPHAVALALEHIASHKENANRTFQIKKYKNYNGMSLKQLKILVKMCPLIQQIFLWRHASSEDFLLALNDLQDLRDLTLMEYKFYDDQVIGVLHSRGRDLRKLNFQGVDQIDLNALKRICQLCPNLHGLDLKNCKNRFNGNWKDDFLTTTTMRRLETRQIEPFRNLKELIFENDDSYSNCNLTNEHLFFLLSNCPAVECIEIYVKNLIKITDDFILKALDKNPLRDLRKLQMCYHSKQLSESVINQIVQNCVHYTPQMRLISVIDDI